LPDYPAKGYETRISVVEKAGKDQKVICYGKLAAAFGVPDPAFGSSE
jgi:hypothetical protein